MTFPHQLTLCCKFRASFAPAAAVAEAESEMTQQAPDWLLVLQVLVPARPGEKPQLPSQASLKGTAKKYTLDACLDGTVSQVTAAEQPLLGRQHHVQTYPLQIANPASYFTIAYAGECCNGLQCG